MAGAVVVGVDGTGRSLKALVWAAQDAALHGSPLRLVHALPRWEGDIPLFPPGRFELAESHGREILGEAVELVRETRPDVRVSTASPRSTPTEALLAESAFARSIVLGGKGENVGNVLLGSTALQVVGHAACPVIVVPHLAAGHRQVVVGTDGSADSDAALAHAFAEASARGCGLAVVEALGLPQGWPKHLLRPLPPDDEEVIERTKVLEERIAPLRETHPGVDVRLDVHHLAPVPTLADASHRAELMVLGSRGRGGFHGLAVGSVTHELLHLVGCPTMVVRGEYA